jgi:thiol:disulfide interchange protein DsbD
LGFGFAAPFLLLGFWPAFHYVLPKPGAWMVRLREVLAFPMYGAAVWLVWVLALQTNATGVATVLSAMVVMAFSLWLWGTTRSSDARGRGFGAVFSLALLVGALSLLALLKSDRLREAGTPLSSELSSVIPSQPYTEARLNELRRQHRAVFVNATAAWCITCLVNDERVFSQQEVRDAFASRHVVYLLADWTNRNSEITALLQAHGRSGVPLYLYYGPGAAQAKILPQVLTAGEVTTALNSGNGR